MAGRGARCACGTLLTCPAAPPDADLPAASTSANAIPVAVVAAAPVVATLPRAPAMLSYHAHGPAASARPDPETITNLYMPMWLLGGGVAVQAVAALLRERRGIDVALTRLGIEMIFGTAVMLGGLLIVARLRGIALGPFWRVVFKLSAVAVAPAAVAALAAPLLDHIPLGFLIGWVIEFVLYFALLGVFFDLDQSDTWACVWVIFLVRVAAILGLWWAFNR